MNEPKRFGRSRLIRVLSFALALGLFQADNSLAVTQAPDRVNPSDSLGKKVEQDETDTTSQLTEDQKILAEQYKLLEDKLFTLYEFEQKSNPARSKLLQRAFTESQKSSTASRMTEIVALLASTKLKDAESNQIEVIKQLESLLVLLESEDRGKRVRDEIKRHQEYLKEVERLQRIQKGIRGQTEGGLDKGRLENSQEKVANRTKKLAGDIRENEEETESDSNRTPGESSESESGGAGKSDKSDEGSDKKDPSENPDDQSNPDGLEGADKSEPDEQNGEPGEPAQGQSSKGQPGEGAGGKGGSSDQKSQEEDNPIRKRIEAAEKKMRDAQQKLEKAQRKQSVEDMMEAERELEEARRELEEILRQLREEEVERVLAMLEGRFRQMLEREIKVYESTRGLNGIDLKNRLTDFEIKAGKLSVEQKSIALEASRALQLLREDGSSVAFPETVEQMYLDMEQVSARLGGAKVGNITQEIEEDIIETLDYMIEALVKAQQDMESQAGQGGGGGSPGDEPLVDSLAEIKMIRGLQTRIYRRHRRYSRLLEDPDDLLGESSDPDIREALDRLSERQDQLTEITRDIAIGKNK